MGSHRTDGPGEAMYSHEVPPGTEPTGGPSSPSSTGGGPDTLAGAPDANGEAGKGVPGILLADGGSVRYNEGKLRWDLVPIDALEEVVKVYGYGVGKYGAAQGGARNWERGGSWLRTFASATRHLMCWRLGRDRDDESGLYHLAHTAWNIQALLTYQVRGIPNDDRGEHD